MGFARILAHYPYVVLLVVCVVTTTCLIVCVTIPKSLDFSEPLAGFEPRGTEISDRLMTYQNILANVDNTVDLYPFVREVVNKGNTADNDGSGSVSEGEVTRQYGEDETRDEDDARVDDDVDDVPGNVSTRLLSRANFDADNYFCGLPDKNLVRIVYRANDGTSLLSAEKLRTICRLEEEYFDSNPEFTASCQQPCYECNECCRRLSLPNFVALLAKKMSCHNITDSDVRKLFGLLSSCAGYYHNLTLGPFCGKLRGDNVWYGGPNQLQETCLDVPLKCSRRNIAYTILHYLVDRQFLEQPQASGTIPPVLYVASFLPVAVSESNLQLFEHLDSLPREYQDVEIAGAHFAVKYRLFEKYLIADSVWLGLAATLIFMEMWLYTTSIFVTFMTFLSIFWALVTAYFLYTFVFEIVFFPYMNMVTIVIMIGIGADDLFIYCKIWHLAKSEKNNGVLEKIISDTLRHSVLSMLVTSLTTAAAFYANFISDITAIRCFSIYAGTAVACNFILTITWMPASIMLFEKWCNFYLCRKAEIYTGDFSLCYCMCKMPYRLYYLVCEWSRIFFEQILPCLVIKLRYLWLVIYGCLGICSVIVIFYYPRLRLPSTKRFQVFSDNHLLERYDFKLSNMFAFEMSSDDEDMSNFPITIVWGVHAMDRGDFLNPKKKGTLYFDERFDLTTAAAQRWLLDFCHHLRRTDFYLNVPGTQLTNCFLENFINRYMKQRCNEMNSLCCNRTKFPYTKPVFVECLNQYVPALFRTPNVHYSTYSPGPRFHNGHISAFIVQFQSKERYTQDFLQAEAFYRKVNRWVTEELLKAPAEMRNGWFVSHLDFYDLQKSLVEGTPLAIGVSLSVVAVVTFFTMLNVLISLYAIITIACIIVVTLASLVLLGWELNVLESVVITVAIGMAIDYTLHYGVAYRLAPDLDREMRVASSIGRMGSPVAMAAVTTFTAGLFMLPSTVLAYRMFGTFLMLLVSISWVYATFFFQSLLRTIGPQGSFGQFHWPASDCCSPGSREHVDKTVYALSESTLSSSSANHASSEIHEMEPLTSSQDMRAKPNTQVQNHHYTSLPQSLHQHHRPHSYHRPRTRGQYTQVKTNFSKKVDSREVKQDGLQSIQARPEESLVTFESPERHPSSSVKSELTPRGSTDVSGTGVETDTASADISHISSVDISRTVSAEISPCTPMEYTHTSTEALDPIADECARMVLTSADMSCDGYPQILEVL